MNRRASMTGEIVPEADIHGFETVEQFHHDSGLVEGIGYRDGHLMRYTAGSRGSSPFECTPITLTEALVWWTEQLGDEASSSTGGSSQARAHFLEDVKSNLENPSGKLER